MDSTIENEVLKDFKTTLGNINFNNYNPNSPEFTTSLFVGLMWKLIHELNEDSEELMDMKTVKINEKENDEISEEIRGAKKYLQKYFDSNDSTFLEMSKDELKHAEVLIKKAYSKLPNSEEKMKLKSYEDEIKAISNQM